MYPKKIISSILVRTQIHPDKDIWSILVYISVNVITDVRLKKIWTQNQYQCWGKLYQKYFSSAVLRLRGRLFMAPWYGFQLFDKKGKYDWFLHEGILLD